MDLNETNIIKIRVFIPLIPDAILIRNENGSFIGSPEFTEMAYEADAKFREPIITFINDELGIHTWAIRFTQFDEAGKIFDAKLYCENQSEALKMVSIIKNRIPDITFKWYYGGTLSKYIEQK